MELNSSRDAMEDAQIYKTCTDLDEGVAITSNKSKRKSGLSFNITLDQLQLHAGKKLCDVAKELGVGRSTIKRACRDYGIIRWPNSKNKKNPSLFMASTQSDRVGNSKRQSVVKTRDDTTLRPNLLLHQQPILDDNIGKCNQNVAKLTKNEAVIIKATFGEDTVKFKLDISYKMDKLNQEVASRFDIEVGSFKLKYLDGDGNWILVGRDDDLQSCINNLKELGQTKVEVSVQSIYQIRHSAEKARTIGEENDRALEESNMNQQDLLSEIENKNNIINELNKTRLEEAQKKDRLERELVIMETVLEGYRKALKETQKAFAEYRERAQLPEEPIYRDAGDGGLMLTAAEIKKLKKK